MHYVIINCERWREKSYRVFIELPIRNVKRHSNSCCNFKMSYEWKWKVYLANTLNNWRYILIESMFIHYSSTRWHPVGWRKYLFRWFFYWRLNALGHITFVISKDLKLQCEVPNSKRNKFKVKINSKNWPIITNIENLYQNLWTLKKITNCLYI